MGLTEHQTTAKNATRSSTGSRSPYEICIGIYLNRPNRKRMPLLLHIVASTKNRRRVVISTGTRRTYGAAVAGVDSVAFGREGPGFDPGHGRSTESTRVTSKHTLHNSKSMSNHQSRTSSPSRRRRLLTTRWTEAEALEQKDRECSAVGINKKKHKHTHTQMQSAAFVYRQPFALENCVRRAPATLSAARPDDARFGKLAPSVGFREHLCSLSDRYANRFTAFRDRRFCGSFRRSFLAAPTPAALFQSEQLKIRTQGVSAVRNAQKANKIIFKSFKYKCPSYERRLRSDWRERRPAAHGGSRNFPILQYCFGVLSLANLRLVVVISYLSTFVLRRFAASGNKVLDLKTPVELKVMTEAEVKIGIVMRKRNGSVRESCGLRAHNKQSGTVRIGLLAFYCAANTSRHNVRISSQSSDLRYLAVAMCADIRPDVQLECTMFAPQKGVPGGGGPARAARVPLRPIGPPLITYQQLATKPLRK
ncbi:hypothetical protein EVAR_5860_1 [Eumeta japonica]|uniref:Uncharacterized protein n=1 Tax=Eumeta variegata TaxID=151549 RepID=A0A4C1TBX2_EUMVA|nr:hypothetical protein EVAR_5860_1 [Eumeta japonica]